MASAAFHAHGSLLKMGDGGSPESFTTVAEITSLSGPALTQETIDVTSHDSSNGWREFIGGLKDAGEVSATLNYLPTNATQNDSAGLIYVLGQGTLKNWQMVFADASSRVVAFAALVTAVSITSAIDAQATAEVTLKISGELTWS